jgi:hypothetical protein
VHDLEVDFDKIKRESVRRKAEGGGENSFAMFGIILNDLFVFLRTRVERSHPRVVEPPRPIAHRDPSCALLPLW